MTVPERSDERDAALDALVGAVPFRGWTTAALQRMAGPDADLLFPGGPLDMVESWSDLTDRRTQPVSGDRVPDRVRAAVVQRLDRVRPSKEAVRRGLALLSGRPATASRVTLRTVDALWLAAGDQSVGSSWYTKRATLAGVYGATLLFWLRDDSDGDAATLAFLDRRLAGVGSVTKLRRRADAWLQRCRPGGAA